MSGALTTATASDMRAVFSSYAKQGSVRLLVDLEAVESLDAAGVAALLEGRRIVEDEMGGRFYLRPGPNGRRALQQSCTIGAFRLWKDE